MLRNLCARILMSLVIGTFSLAGAVIFVDMDALGASLAAIDPGLGLVVLFAFPVSFCLAAFPVAGTAVRVMHGPFKNGVSLMLTSGGGFLFPAAAAFLGINIPDWQATWLLALGLAVAGQWTGVLAGRALESGMNKGHDPHG